MRTMNWIKIGSAAALLLYAWPTGAAWAEASGTAGAAVSAPSAGDAAVAAVSQTYALTEQLDVRIKSVASLPAADGTQASAVVLLTNHSSEKVRVPEYELHLIAKNGSDYLLASSADNVTAVLPDSTVELSYLVQINGKGKVEPDQLSWQDVNDYVFPKTIQEVLSIPVSNRVWTGIDSDTDEAKLPSVRWNEPFALADLDSPIRYRLTQADDKDTGEGHSITVQVLADNTDSSRIQSVPSFVIGAGDSSHLTAGRMSETAPVTLQPGEKKYLHFQIDLDKDAHPKSYEVLSAEHFTRTASGGQASTVSYTAGMYRIPLEAGSLTSQGQTSANYAFGTPITLDRVSDDVPNGLEVKLVDLHRLTTDDLSNDTMVARFLFTNTGNSTIPKPALQTELESKSMQYAGTAFQSAVQLLTPGSTYLFSYSYSVPPEAGDDSFVLKVKGASGSSGSNVLAAVRVAPGSGNAERDMMFYPFKVTYDRPSFVGWTASINPMTRATEYSYKLIMDLNIDKLAQVVPDNSLSQLRIDLTDVNGSVLATRTLAFAGPNRTLGGKQDLVFSNLNTELLAPLTVKIYEDVQTPSGIAQRLLETFQS